jgi:hypothetical protein
MGEPGHFVHDRPSPQNAVDLFAGEWASHLPAPPELSRTGANLLFADARLEWGLSVLGGVRRRNVLELGPLEGGHTYMMERAGARSILAIEGNPRAYLRCLVVKELYRLQAATFACGDFMPYLEDKPGGFDLCVASGVLYHLDDPVKMIARLAAITNRVYFWTHYYDPVVMGTGPMARRFYEEAAPPASGFAPRSYRMLYGTARDQPGFCGGGGRGGRWLSRADILGALTHFGFRSVTISFEDPVHPNGPCMAIAASRLDDFGLKLDRARSAAERLWRTTKAKLLGIWHRLVQGRDHYP